MKQRINSMSYQMHILTVIFFRNLKFFKFSGISGIRVRVQILYPYPIGYGPSYLGSGTGTDFETRPRPVWHFNFPSVYYYTLPPNHSEDRTPKAFERPFPATTLLLYPSPFIFLNKFRNLPQNSHFQINKIRIFPQNSSLSEFAEAIL